MEAFLTPLIAASITLLFAALSSSPGRTRHSRARIQIKSGTRQPCGPKAEKLEDFSEQDGLRSIREG